MQYVWQHRLWRSEDMVTNDGRRVRVLDPGLLNTDQGPDFFNAKVEIDGHTWIGNVEMHVRATDWKRHNHHTDKAYDSVILHVVEKDDAPVYRSNGERIPQLVLQLSPRFNESLDALLNARTELPCAASLASMPSLLVTEWVQRLAFERLHGKVERIRSLYDLTRGNWEEVCYVTLARALGFGVNSEAMERLARRTPLRLLHKHSDSLLQVEALLFGQAGMLAAPATDAYTQQLAREYAFLRNKFALEPMEGEAWRVFRMRPPNFPYRRIALLAHYIHGGFNLMHTLLECRDERSLREVFDVELDGYWATHYSLGKASTMTARALGNSSVDIILINTVAPLYYAYGEIAGNALAHSRAIGLLEALRPEHNAVVAAFAAAGLRCDDALTSQALIQLKRDYCEARKCIYCKFGHRLLSQAAHTP